MKISYPGDCGNSPRKCFLIELHRAYAEGNFELLVASASTDIVWSLAGQWLVEGRAAYEKALREKRGEPVDELIIEHVITHGREAAVSGRYRVADKWFCFADIYVFTSTTSSTLKSVQSLMTDDTVKMAKPPRGPRTVTSVDMRSATFRSLQCHAMAIGAAILPGGHTGTR